MINDYAFWNSYLKKIDDKIKELCNKKDELLIDFHIHSTYSADGKQSIKQIIESTNSKKFDIIAITDHDSLLAYNELYDIVKNGTTVPLIIPGVEFTIDNKEYGNQCHMLQLFVNPKDDAIIKNVDNNYKASFNRSKIQFKRIEENEALQEIFKESNILVSYDEYVDFLNNNNMFPEYDTLCTYLMQKLLEKGVTTFDVFEKLQIYNELDKFEDRKTFKQKRFEKLKQKYERNELNDKNTRFLLSMLAVREVDDDWWDNPSSGSLSVNSYGQLKIEELNKKYYTFFAHPTESSLEVVDRIIKENKNIIGMELNRRCEYNQINKFDEILAKNGMLKIIGSDSHDNSLQFYDDMNFYRIKSNEILKILNKIGG